MNIYFNASWLLFLKGMLRASNPKKDKIQELTAVQVSILSWRLIEFRFQCWTGHFVVDEQIVLFRPGFGCFGRHSDGICKPQNEVQCFACKQNLKSPEEMSQDNEWNICLQSATNLGWWRKISAMKTLPTFVKVKQTIASLETSKMMWHGSLISVRAVSLSRF